MESSNLFSLKSPSFSNKRTRPRPVSHLIGCQHQKRQNLEKSGATSTCSSTMIGQRKHKLFPVVSIRNVVVVSSLIVFFNIIIPSPVEGLAVVRRNVVKIPHDVHPGYAIKRFGFGASTEHTYRLMPNEYSSYFTVLDNVSFCFK